MHTIEDIDNEMVTKQKKLKQSLQDKEVVAIERLELDRQILSLRQKKKELDIVYEKSQSIVQQLRIEVSILNTKKWSRKEGF